MSVVELGTEDDSTVVFVVTLSSLFFQLSELVEQLKAQLELEEVSDNPDNIATVLTNLKHQGEATLDSIHTAIDEGETIIDELKLASSEGVDSSSLQHVEKVIKELDRVRRAIEHSWTRRRQQLELWLQLREFERSAKLVFIPFLIVHGVNLRKEIGYTTVYVKIDSRRDLRNSFPNIYWCDRAVHIA